jgi:hypothetical protein
LHAISSPNSSALWESASAPSHGCDLGSIGRLFFPDSPASFTGRLALELVDWRRDNALCLWVNGKSAELGLREAARRVCSLLLLRRADSREDSISTTAYSSRSGGRFFNRYRRSDHLVLERMTIP